MVSLSRGVVGAAALVAGLIGLIALTAQAQTIEVYPEFRRLDPFGGTVAVDRAISPREILSPAVPRNGFASFHIAISVPPKESYLLYVATNPLNACRVALYREHFVKTPAGYITDTLTELTRLPDFGVMQDPDDNIEGQNTRLYLLDLWIPPDSSTARFRLEVQLKVADWIIHPLEFRPMEIRIPDLPAPKQPVTLPAIEQSADAVALDAIREYLGGLPASADPHPLTLRGIIRRNAEQDMALAASLPRDIAGKDAIQRRVMELLAINNPLRTFGAEWYQRLRDFLFVQK